MREACQLAGMGCGIMGTVSFTYLSISPPQDREPLRTIFLKDVLKTHECLVKSG